MRATIEALRAVQIPKSLTYPDDAIFESIMQFDHAVTNVKAQLDELNPQRFAKLLVAFMEAVPECASFEITASGSYEYNDNGATYFSRSVGATCSLDQPITARSHVIVPISEDLCDGSIENPGDVLAERFAEDWLDTETYLILPDLGEHDAITLTVTRAIIERAKAGNNGAVNLKVLLDAARAGQPDPLTIMPPFA